MVRKYNSTSSNMEQTNKTITIPYHFTPRDYQLELLQSKQRFKIAVLHRRAGKSKYAINQQIARACKKKGIYYYILPTYAQAKKVAWDELVKLHVPPEIVDKTNESELAIYYKNGSIQRFLGSDNPDSLRGVNCIDVVFDEYAEQNPRVWTEIIQPVLRENKGTATFIFTPKGTNHAYNLLLEAKNNPEEWFVSVKGYMDTKVFTEQEIQEIKKATPQAVFEQEYACQFLDSGTQVFKGIDRIVHDSEYPPNSIHTYQCGVDLAKSMDWTVLTVFDKMTQRIVEIQRFNQIDWALQKTKIEVLKHKYGNISFKVDATGVGSPIVEDLSRMGLDVEGIVFTEKSRTELLNNLQIKIENQQVFIPRNETLINELKSMQFTFNETSRRLKMQVSEGLHDDMIFSLCLAVWGTSSRPMNPETSNVFDLNRLIGDRSVNVNIQPGYF